MHFKKKMHRIRANDKFKLAESFCRNFVFLTRKVAYEKISSIHKATGGGCVHFSDMTIFKDMKNFIF